MTSRMHHLDPISDDWAMVIRGEGAWIERLDGSTSALQVAPAVPLAEMTGNVSWRYLPKELRPVVTGSLPQLAMAADFRCAAHMYRLIASGHLHAVCPPQAYLKARPPAIAIARAE
jgi:hypothetical protein